MKNAPLMPEFDDLPDYDSLDLMPLAHDARADDEPGMLAEYCDSFSFCQDLTISSMMR